MSLLKSILLTTTKEAVLAKNCARIPRTSVTGKMGYMSDGSIGIAVRHGRTDSRETSTLYGRIPAASEQPGFWNLAFRTLRGERSPETIAFRQAFGKGLMEAAALRRDDSDNPVLAAGKMFGRATQGTLNMTSEFTTNLVTHPLRTTGSALLAPFELTWDAAEAMSNAMGFGYSTRGSQQRNAQRALTFKWFREADFQTQSEIVLQFGLPMLFLHQAPVGKMIGNAPNMAIQSTRQVITPLYQAGNQLAKRSAVATREFLQTREVVSPITFQFGSRGAVQLNSGIPIEVRNPFPVKVKKPLGGWTIKSRMKAAQLPNEGRVRYIPPKFYKPSMKLPHEGNIGFKDRFNNIWKKGPSRTPGESFEWDVTLSESGKKQFKWLVGDKEHLNVSLKGRITHR